jgi:hypothetical protein
VALRRAADQVLVQVQLRRQVRQPRQRVDAEDHGLHGRRRLQVIVLVPNASIFCSTLSDNDCLSSFELFLRF